MKHTFVLFISLFSLALKAQNVKSIDPKITDVTVFLSGAQVTHAGDVAMKAGENQFKLGYLPLQLDPNSIQVEGNNNYMIVSVRHQVNYLQNTGGNAEWKAVKDSLDFYLFQAQEIAGLKNVVIQEKQLLEANREMKGNNAVLIADDLMEMANFFKERFKQIEYRWLELSEQSRINQENIQRMQNQMNSLNQRNGTNPSEILITIRAEKDGKFPLRLSYFTQNAGWYPNYDLRAEDINSPIELIYRAKVFQSTGNDWKGVNLTISTGNPIVGGQIPVLYPWYLYPYNLMNVAMVESYSHDRNDTPSVAYQSGAEYKLEERKSVADYTQVTNNTVNTEFKISLPYDIPSDNQQYDVIMQRETIKGAFDYVTVPKLDNDAFLRARLTDWMQYSLLPGESNIYFKGTFVGKGFIDPAQAVDTLTVSLGRDRAIQVKREQIKEFSKTSLFGGKQKTTKAFEISVTNTKKQAITIEIQDQLPISQNADIEVEMEETSGASVGANQQLSWKITLQPGETIKKQVRFNVKYPKKSYVQGL